MTTLSLYQLTGEWLALAHKLSDMDLDSQTIVDTIEGSEVQMALEEKVQGYELVARTMEAPRSFIQAEIKRLQALDKAIEARSKALRERVQDSMAAMGVQKITCPLFEVRIQKNPASLDVYDERMVPGDYWHTPEPVAQLDRAALKTALKEGKEVQGARLTYSESLRIK